MKTVNFYRKHGGHLARLTNAEAAVVVDQKHGIYCPKHWYKAAKHLEAAEATA